MRGILYQNTLIVRCTRLHAFRKYYMNSKADTSLTIEKL